MIASKYITKIIAAVMAITVCLCLCAMAFSDTLAATAGGTEVTMEYETKLFDTSEPIQINIVMNNADWEDMLANATSETYYTCNVEVNGKLFYNVGLRPKGNTSLTSIASNPDTDRFSLKLEFDRFVEGQTCYGLDKLALNNNYADATNMKEALIYDMYAYLGADASLYNYAKISVNGEYWGVYLAVEAVEDSFLLRNYGVENGALYKPDSMDIGGGMDGDQQREMPEGFDPSQAGGEMPEGFDPTQRGEMPEGFDPSQAGGEMPEGFDPSQAGGEMPEGFDPSQAGGEMPEGFDPSQAGGEMPEGFDPTQRGEMPEGFDPTQRGDEGDEGRQNMHGGMSMGGSGSNLSYTDDELDSYATIWDCEVTGTSKNDHKRVVKALKNIAAGTDLEAYMDIDNLLKYMAVHVFSVNEDSLTGTMAHNYYLYEYKGRLNLLPWDYNLSFGGMGSGSDATSTVNAAIDNAFTGTTFFDTLMENETYRAQYHAYLRQLSNEYVNGGGFEEFYTRTRRLIDKLVQTDPTAFYTYDEYTDAAETLCSVVKLRAESVEGQVNGTIPSTESEQRNSDALIDASNIDLTVMGVMDMGGGRNFIGNDQTQPASEETADDAVGRLPASSGDTQTAPSRTMREDFDPSRFSGKASAGMDDANAAWPDRQNFDPSAMDGASSASQMKSIILCGVCAAILMLALGFAWLFRRKRRK